MSVSDVISEWSAFPARHPPKIKNRMNTGGHNAHYIVEAGRFSELFCKVCRHDDVVQDICEREQFASMAAKVVGVSFARAWVVKLDGIIFQEQRDSAFVQDRCVLSEFVTGRQISKGCEPDIELIKSVPNQIADIYAFLHWLGDEDRGVTDLLVTPEHLTLIDGGLCGPRKGETQLRGAHPYPEKYTDLQVLKKCYPGKPSVIRIAINDAGIPKPELEQTLVIERIQSLRDSDIRELVQFCKLNDYVADTLIKRRQTISDDYANWLNEAYERLIY